ncbi:hypothetical protein D3C76_1027850 [compost metagenome]
MQRHEAQMQVAHHPPADGTGQGHAQQYAEGGPPEVAGTPGPHLLNPIVQLLIEAILALLEQAYLVGTQGKPGFGIHPKATACRLLQRQFFDVGHLGHHGRGQAVGQQLTLRGAG